MAPRKRHPLAGAPDYSLLDLLEALRPQQGKGLGDLDPVRHFGVPGGIPGGGGGGGGGVPNSSGAGTPAHPSLPPSPGPVRTPTVPYDPGAPPTPVQQAIRHDTPLPAGLTNPTPPLPSLTPLTPGQASPTTPQTGLTAALQQLLQLKPAALGQSALEQAQQSVPEVRHTLDTAAPITPQTDPRNQPIRIHLGQTQDGPSPSMTNTEALRTLGIGGDHARPGSTEQQVYDALFGKGPVPPAPDLKTQLPQIPNQQTSRMTGLGTRQTLGTPSSGSVLQAVEGGTLGLTPKGGPVPGGLVTTPTTSGALGDFLSARQAFNRAARPDLSGLSPLARADAPLIEAAHRAYPDVPASLLAGLTEIESGFKPGLTSPAGAGGKTQFIPGTAETYNVDVGTSRAATRSQYLGAAHYLHDLGIGGNPALALAKYNAGPGNPAAGAGYAQDVLAAAQGYGALDKRTVAPANVRSAFNQAKQQIKRLNISTPGGPGTPGPDNLPGTTFVRADGAGVVKWAKAVLGTDEGTPRQIKWSEAMGVDPSAPWCSVFAAYALSRRGIKPPANPAYSGDWLNWPGGHKVEPSKIKPGDLVIFDWGDGGITDHVAIYTGNGKVIGGNQSDSVTEVPWDQGATVGVVRPNYSGKKVAVQDSGAPGAGASYGTGTGGVASSLIAAGAPAGVVGAAQAQANQPPMIPLTPLAPPFAPQVAMPEGYTPTETGAPTGQDTTLLDLLQQLYTPQVSIVGQRKRR